MDETLKANIIDLLAHHNVMMLATNIQLNKKVSVAIADEIDNSYKLRALSLSGIAERIIRLLDSHRSVASRRPF
jgi:hypothetical protein